MGLTMDEHSPSQMRDKAQQKGGNTPLHQCRTRWPFRTVKSGTLFRQNCTNDKYL